MRSTFFPKVNEDVNMLQLAIDVGVQAFIKVLKHLDSLVTSNLNYDKSAEVNARNNSAFAAFASLRSQLFRLNNV